MRLVLLLVLAVGLSACAPRTFDPANEWELLREFRGREGWVQVAGERSTRVRGIRMDPDSSSWVEARTGTFRIVPTRDVLRVTRLEGVGESARRGARTGAIVSGVLVSPLVISGDGGLASVLPGFVVVFGTLSGAAFGAVDPARTRFRALPVAEADTLAARTPGVSPWAVRVVPSPD